MFHCMFYFTCDRSLSRRHERADKTGRHVDPSGWSGPTAHTGRIFIITSLSRHWKASAATKMTQKLEELLIMADM